MTMTLSSEGAMLGALCMETTLSWGKLAGTMNLMTIGGQMVVLTPA